MHVRSQGGSQARVGSPGEPGPVARKRAGGNRSQPVEGPPPRFVCAPVATRALGLRDHDHPGLAACGCGVHASLVTPRKLPAATSALDPVTYQVSIDNPASGYALVTARFPADGKQSLDLAMARWTPGSYKVRDYEKHVDDDVKAYDEKGEPLAITKTGISQWRVETNGAAQVTVRYRVYSHSELSVRTNWIEPAFALLNGASTFMTLAGETHERRHDVTIEAPTYAAGPVSALPNDPRHPARFSAASFDALVDSPIAIGAESRREIVLDGVTYVVATHGADDVWDVDKAVAALTQALKQVHAFWGRPPFDRYVFMNLLAEARGGLEHKDSTVLMHSRWSTRDRGDFLNWVSLAVHELFHAWNVKRLRPLELGPFDYMRENVTASLWVAEGITSYYDKLLVRRSGVSTPQEYLGYVSRAIAAIQGQPGRKVQTLAQSSHDAWTNYYQPDENSPNVTVSYYEKGALVAALLDAEIRKVSGDTKSLDDVMRAAFARYSGEKGYTPAQFEALISEVAGHDMSAWLHRAIRTTEELPVDEALKTLGLRFKETKPADGAYLGVDTKVDGYRLVVTRVIPGTPGATAGLMVGDEILGLGDYRVPPSELDARLKRYQPGETTSVLVARRGRFEKLPLTFGLRDPRTFEVELDPDADGASRARRMAWMGA